MNLRHVYRSLSVLYLAVVTSLGQATIVTANSLNQATPSSVPITPQLTIAGNASANIPKGEEASIAVVAYGPIAPNTQIPVVIRNNTSVVQTDIAVVATVYSGNDELLAVSETSSFKPFQVNPGEIAIGFVQMGVDITIDGDNKLTFQVAGDEDAGGFADYVVDLHFGEVAWQGDRIVGVAVNPSNEIVDNAYLHILCFEPDGDPREYSPTTIQTEIQPNSEAPFQESLFFLGDCESFLVAGSALTS